MALLFTQGPANVDSLLTTTLSNYRDTMADNIYTRFPLFHWLNKKGRKRLVDGGASIVEPLMYGKNTTAAWYSYWGQLDVTPQEGMTTAQYTWAQLAVSIAISRLEERQNSGRHRILDLLKARIDQAELAAYDKFSTAVWSAAQVTNAVVPLDVMVDTTPSLGQISGSTYTWWQATKTASGSFAAQGRKDMTTLWNTLSKYGFNDSPDLVITTQTVLESYESTVQAQERYIKEKTGDLGVETFAFKTAPMIFDENAVSGNLYMLNSRYLSLAVDKETDFITSAFVRPENQDGKVAQILWYGALTTNNRRKMGKLTGLTA